MMSAAAAEMDALSARLNQVLRLGSGWMVQCDAIRSCAPGYPDSGAFPDPVTRVIDDERRQFMEEGAHFESEYFLTLTYPPPEVEERAKGWLFEGDSASIRSRAAARHLDHFRLKLDAFENVFGQLSKQNDSAASPSSTVTAASIFTTGCSDICGGVLTESIIHLHCRKYRATSTRYSLAKTSMVV